jgi:hypothetical protein
MKNLFYFLLLFSCGLAFGQYPKTDDFTGSGSLGPNYTCSSNAGATLSKSSGTVTAAGPSYASCAWIANSFDFFGLHNMQATVTTPSAGAENSGPALLDSSGNGYAWPLNSKQIQKVVHGFPSGISDYICPIPAAGHAAALTRNGSTLTCIDITANGTDGITCNHPGAGACSTITDSTYTPTSPGFIAFSGQSITGPFSADCFPAACGVLPYPTPSAATAEYGVLEGVTAAMPSNSVGCYTTDGSTPAAPNTFGTCPPGTTTYHPGDTISLTPKSTNTIKMLATSATNAANSAVTTWVYNLRGVVMKANSPGMGWPVLKGSVITLNASLQYGKSNTVTAAISGNYGTPLATGTLDSTGPGNSVRTLTVGDVAGTCSVPQIMPVMHGVVSGGAVKSGAITFGGSKLPPNKTFAVVFEDSFLSHFAHGTFTTNSSGVATSVSISSSDSGFDGNTDETLTQFPLLYSIVSTAGFNVVFTSVDDPSVSVTFPIPVCANTTDVEVLPFYDVLYSGQGRELQVQTTGTSDSRPTWSITSQPQGGNGVLDPSPMTECETTHTCMTTYFVATVSGRYTVQAKNTAEPNIVQHATLYVTGHPMPYKVTPNGTMPVDPTPDPYGKAHGGAVIEIGPSQTFHTIHSAVDFRKISCGTTIRLHNEGTDGSPTSYAEWLFFWASGCQDNPIRLVGVPNASGELPVLEASNAVGPRYPVNGFVFSGVINSWPSENTSGCGIPRNANAFWAAGSAGSCGPNWIVIEGLRIQNARGTTHKRYDPGNKIQNPWNFDAAAISMHSGYGWVIRGNDCYNNSMCVASYTPSNAGWPGVTQMLDVEGNHCQLFGNDGDSRLHCMYLQSNGEVIALNKYENPLKGDQGADLKTRSYLWAVKYNFFGTNVSRYTSHDEVQDAASLFSLDGFFCKYGDCDPVNNATPVSVQYVNAYKNTYFKVSAGTAIPINYLVGYIEAGRNTWEVGNVYQGSPNVQTVHYSADGAGGGSTAPTAMRGTFHFLNNTCAPCGYVLDTLGSGLGSGAISVYEFPRIDVQNNVMYSPGAFTLTTAKTILGSFGKNLYRTGSVQISGTIAPCNQNAGGKCGWGDGVQGITPIWQNVSPIDSHVSGINATNFLFTNTPPVDSNFVPTKGGGAINTGAPPTGLAAFFPARLQFSPSLGYATLRTQPTTLGALDGSTSPALSSNETIPRLGSWPRIQPQTPQPATIRSWLNPTREPLTAR